MMKYPWVLMAIVLGMFGPAFSDEGYFTIEDVQEVVRGVANNRHNAFPAVINYKDKYYLAYREAESHMSRDGIIKVYTSSVAGEWMHKYTLHREGFDMRDGILAEINGNLIVFAAGLEGNGGRVCAARLAPLPEDANPNEMVFVPVTTDIEETDFMFGVKAEGELLYGFSYWYKPSGAHTSGLLVSNDGFNWKTVEKSLITACNETHGVFHDGKLYAIGRNYGRSPSRGVIYDLKTKEKDSFRFDTEIDAPCVFSYDGKDYVIGRAGGVQGECGVHARNQPNVTAMFEVDWKNHKLKWILNFPHGHGNDNAYASITPCGKDRFLVAYYSSNGKRDYHNSKTSIWVATLVYDRMEARK